MDGARPAAFRLSTQVMERNGFVASAAASRWPLSGFFLLYLTGQCYILHQVQGLSITQAEGNVYLHGVLWSAQQKMKWHIRKLRISKTVVQDALEVWIGFCKQKKSKNRISKTKKGWLFKWRPA